MVTSVGVIWTLQGQAARKPFGVGAIVVDDVLGTVFLQLLHLFLRELLLLHEPMLVGITAS